jgi:flagellum-specific ATP synthase
LARSAVATAVGIDLDSYTSSVAEMPMLRRIGRVVQVVGLAIEAEGLRCQLGEMCQIEARRGRPLAAEVVGFREGRVVLMALGDAEGISPGSEVTSSGRPFAVKVGSALLGRVIDGMGRPIDGKGPIATGRRYSITNDPPAPLGRRRIGEVLETGVRAIDGFLTCGKGQRIGIFAGSGVGKSTLLGMIARNALSNVAVIGLIGERGREVREFIERDLGEEGLARSVVVVSTSDQPALVRIKGAWVATAIAEAFREQGMDVTLLVDSVTRFAMAQREVGLAVGEPPATRGYTPSVFALMPRLMERAGTSNAGTMTAFYTVLVEGDDMSEPVTDTARSILDGHIVLSRELAGQNHYPAIDVLRSVSRVMGDVTDRDQRQAAGRLRDLMAAFDNARDLVNIGAYAAGSDPRIDAAIIAMPHIDAFLRQPPEERASFTETVARLKSVAAR